MKPTTKKSRKERDIDKDTVVAYHEFIQGRIQGELNGVTIGPGYVLSRIALVSFVFGVACMIVGILVITLRHRHVYLVDWNAQFLGPFFIIMFLLCSSLSTFLILLAKQRTNQYRRDLAFRPIGDYGVAVVHKSKLTYDDIKKTELKTGTTPHNVRHPGRPGVNDRGNRGDYSKVRGYDNRGYRDDYDRRDRDRNRDQQDGRGRERGDRPPRRDDDRERRRPPPGEDDRRRRPPGDPRGPPRGPRGDPRRRPPEDRDRRPPEDRERRRPDDRERDPNRPRRPPPGPEDERRRAEARRRQDEERRRRKEEEIRREELRQQAESYNRQQDPVEERGVDVDGGQRTYQIQTTVKLSRELQGADESEL